MIKNLYYVFQHNLRFVEQTWIAQILEKSARMVIHHGHHVVCIFLLYLECLKRNVSDKSMSVLVISHSSLNFTIFLADECKTAGGNQPNMNCVFPFRYKETEYESCVTPLPTDLMPWCSTEVNSDGNHVIGAWGDCSEGCPVNAEGMFTRNQYFKNENNIFFQV
jgi:hypothetical protein